MRTDQYLLRGCALLLIVVLWGRVDAAPRLTVTCDDPQGTTTLYESGLLELGEQRWETVPTVYANAHPTFVLDEATPQRLHVTWGASPNETTVPPSPPPSAEAMMLLEARGQITAVFSGAQTVWIFSLFPKLGIGYFTAHSHFPMGYSSRSTSTHAPCQFVWHDQTSGG
jgi:hypothetical protein